MNVTPLIVPNVIPSALPESIIRGVNKDNKTLRPETFIKELTNVMYFAFLIEEIRDYDLKQMFPFRLGGTVLKTVPPDLNTIVLGGTLPDWKEVFKIDHEIYNLIYKLFLATPMKEFLNDLT